MLGLGNKLQKTGLKKIYPGVATGGLVLKSDFGNRETVPISDGSASFDGTDDYIDVGDSTNFITGTNVTISTWFNNSNGVMAYLFQSRRSAGSTNLSLGINFDAGVSEYAGQIGFVMYNGSGHTVTATDENIDDGTWHHLAVTVSDGAQKLYLDGIQVVSSSAAFDNEASSDHSVIGSNSGSNRFMNGNMCNVGIWSAALTAAQIKSIMYKNYSGLSPSEKTNLVSWWNLDEAVDSNNLHVADLVNDTLGATALTNGDFATGDFTGWTAGGPPAGAEVVSHDGHKTAAHITTSSNDHGYNQNTLTAGQVYKVSFDIKVISGSIYLGKDGTQVGGVDYTDSSWTSYTHYWTAPDTYFRIYSEIASSEFYIDNISVQPTNGNYGTLS